MDNAPVYRVLAVDDEPGILTLYRDILCLEAEDPSGLQALFPGQEIGGARPESTTGPIFDLTACATGAEALDVVRWAKAQNRPFAVALIDVRLGPGPDGVEVAETLRALDGLVEIVMVTGHSGLALTELNRRVPPPEKLLYLHKPFRPQELRQLARALGGKWSAECSLRELNENLALLVDARTAELTQANERLSRDIAERHRLEDRLIQSQKMEALGTLAGGIAHDFNNILGVMMGYAEMIRDAAAGGSGLSRRAGEIVTAGDRARDLVNQILNFSRQGPQVKKPLKLAPLIKETLKMMRSAIPASVELRIQVSDPAAHITGDPTQLHQVLLNLCANAAHAMRQEGGRLSVTLAGAAEEGPPLPPELGDPSWYLRLSVSDTGQGMAPEVQERIFDPLFTTQKPGEGTGMGLSVVHGIVKGHDGAITVHSEPGHGSTFHVFLPRTSAMEAQAAPLAAQARPRAARVLLVDDEKPLVDIGREMLEGMGLTVTGRTSSIEALEAFRFRPEAFDLLFTDQSMPNMTGVQLAREVLAIRPELPVILCTGFSEAVSAEIIKGLGLRDLVMKPLLKAQVAASLVRVLGSAGDGP